jgi:hypothetical protein
MQADGLPAGELPVTPLLSLSCQQQTAALKPATWLQVLKFAQDLAYEELDVKACGCLGEPAAAEEQQPPAGEEQPPCSSPAGHNQQHNPLKFPRMRKRQLASCSRFIVPQPS